MRLLLVICFLGLSITGTAQTQFYRNSFYVEAGGAGTTGSVNIERQLTAKAGIGIRAGAGLLVTSETYLTLPVGLVYLMPVAKKEQHYIDVGLHATPLFRLSAPVRNDMHEQLFIVPAVGYRLHTKNRLFLRLSLMYAKTKDHGTPWAGLAFGKLF